MTDKNEDTSDGDHGNPNTAVRDDDEAKQRAALRDLVDKAEGSNDVLFASKACRDARFAALDAAAAALHLSSRYEADPAKAAEGVALMQIFDLAAQDPTYRARLIGDFERYLAGGGPGRASSTVRRRLEAGALEAIVAAGIRCAWPARDHAEGLIFNLQSLPTLAALAPGVPRTPYFTDPAFDEAVEVVEVAIAKRGALEVAASASARQVIAKARATIRAALRALGATPDAVERLY